MAKQISTKKKAPKMDRVSKKRTPASVIAKFGPETERAEQSEKSALRIECTLTVGGLTVEIDASSLAKTIGAGDFGYGQGLVDKWSDAVWIGLLKHLGLSTEPFDRAAAAQPVKRLVQKLWYEAVQPWVLERPVFARRDEETADAYNEKIVEVKDTKKAAAERRERTPIFGRTGKTHYQPTAELKKSKGEGLGGQQAFLAKAFAAAGWGKLTMQGATEGMVKAGLQTTTKPERIAAFYLCKWAKSGLLERVEA